MESRDSGLHFECCMVYPLQLLNSGLLLHVVYLCCELVLYGSNLILISTTVIFFTCLRNYFGELY